MVLTRCWPGRVGEGPLAGAALQCRESCCLFSQLLGLFGSYSLHLFELNLPKLPGFLLRVGQQPSARGTAALSYHVEILQPAPKSSFSFFFFLCLNASSNSQAATAQISVFAFRSSFTPEIFCVSCILGWRMSAVCDLLNFAAFFFFFSFWTSV